MPPVPKIRIASSFRTPDGYAARDSSCGERRFHLYGWDSRSETWHGPNEPSCAVPDKRLLHAFEAMPGGSWYGPVRCCTAGEPFTRFFALVHDLRDCAVTSIYCDESKTGPAEILAVIPAERRLHLRDDFAFEFLAFARFLGSLSAGSELRVHDSIALALTEDRDSDALVFTISSGLWPGDLDHILSRCVERIAVTLCQWMDGTSVLGKHAGPGSISAA